MPAYEGEDHWIWFTKEWLQDSYYSAREILMAEERIRNLGRNLAVAGALEAAYCKGHDDGQTSMSHLSWWGS